MPIIIPVLVFPIKDNVRNGSMEKLLGQVRRALCNELKIAVEINPNANSENGAIQ